MSVTSAPTVRTTPSRNLLALAGLVGPLLFVLAIVVCDVVQHSWLVRHNYDPATMAPVSDNALGPYGIIQTIGFLAIGIGIMSLARALHLHLPHQRRRDLVGVIALALTGLALFAGAATEDAPNSPAATSGHYTWHGWMHNIGFAVMLFSQLVAYPFLWRRMRRDPRWSGHARLTLTWAIALLPAFLACNALEDLLHISAFYLWLLLFPIGWPLHTAIRLRRLQRTATA
jgi:hypothetical protein